MGEFFMLTKEDYMIIEVLISLADDIYESTVDLYLLEIANEKNTEEYSKKIKSIKDNNATFNYYLSKLGVDYKKIIGTYNYLLSLNRFANLRIASSSFNIAFSTNLDDKNSMVFAFLKNRLYQKAVANPDYLMKICAKDLGEIEDEEFKKATEKILLFRYKYTLRIIEDIYMLFLTILNNSQNKTNNKEIIEKLTKLKYSYSLLLPYIQDYFVNKSYEVDAEPFITHHCIADLFHMDEKEFYDIENSNILTIIKGHLEFIKYLNDDAIIDYHNLSIAINVEAIIRACLVIADDETRSAVEDILKEMCQNLNSKTNKYQIITDILNNIPEKREIDLSLVRIVNIRPPQD